MEQFKKEYIKAHLREIDPDVATARNAGVEVWALPYGYNMGQTIESCNPDRVIADCSALLNS